MSEKLQKVLAQLGLGSRRQLERWIADGRVSVNGKTATLGARVERSDKIKVDGKPVKLPDVRERIRLIVYNKPEGEVSTRDDPEGRPTVYGSLPPLRRGRWIGIGRLDINTSGLLLFTNNGELANAMMHPSSEVEREYLVRVHGEVDDAMIQRLQEGVLLEDGTARFLRIAAGGAGNSNQWFSVVLGEGRNREVRRLWESQGIEVNRLKRLRQRRPAILCPARGVAGAGAAGGEENLQAAGPAGGYGLGHDPGRTPQAPAPAPKAAGPGFRAIVCRVIPPNQRGVAKVPPSYGCLWGRAIGMAQSHDRKPFCDTPRAGKALSA